MSIAKGVSWGNHQVKMLSALVEVELKFSPLIDTHSLSATTQISICFRGSNEKTPKGVKLQDNLGLEVIWETKGAIPLGKTFLG